jgi:hypothetical protein
MTDIDIRAHITVEYTVGGGRRVRLQNVKKRKHREPSIRSVARFIEVECGNFEAPPPVCAVGGCEPWTDEARFEMENVLLDTPPSERGAFLRCFAAQLAVRLAATTTPHVASFAPRDAWPLLLEMIATTPLSDATHAAGIAIVRTLEADAADDSSNPDWHGLARAFFATLDAEVATVRARLE